MQMLTRVTTATSKIIPDMSASSGHGDNERRRSDTKTAFGGDRRINKNDPEGQLEEHTWIDVVKVVKAA